ncbi:hypothetical protein MUCCIDRAFT_112112 [Mucor lusitanicus CBS 277.49]|uniref:F-box domain-containing protein n=2 Tax=Mucor circinelloides f. lusitanicus TaxID=29924 RepID=A0A168J3J2_MUCCL|nr:hypothetical protein MUCCIDRAFT_112112 [Mucor lusitanicus CBS 277.49]
MATGLLDLPNELVMYILANFLDLSDLWRLHQTSSQLRMFASTVIQTTWKIDMKSSMKVQCRAALIVLQDMATQHAQIRPSPTTSSSSSTTTTTKMEALLTVVAGYDGEKEQVLQQKIMRGISSYKHKYVLIQDIDIRNRIRTAVGLIFHHAVFVSAIIRCRRSSSVSSFCCSNSSSPPSSSTETRKTNDNDAQHRALAIAMVRLLTKLDTSFDSYHREVTYTLADEIKAFLEYTGHKLLAKQTPQTQQLLLHSMSACFDLMGAALVFKVLGDNHVDYAVQRTCELFGSSCGNFKSVLLTDLLNHWLIMKREVGTSELCRYVRIEIEKM